MFQSAKVKAMVAFDAEYYGIDGDENYISFKIPMENVAGARSGVRVAIDRGMQRLSKWRHHQDFDFARAIIAKCNTVLIDFVDLLTW